MSAILQASGLSAGHGERTLFSDLDLVVAPGDVIGLVGVNGAGKSTLLRRLSGTATTDAEGTVTLSPPDATVGHLAQEPERVAGETILEFLSRRTGVAEAEAHMNTAAESLGNLAADDTAAEDLYTPALEKWLALGGADLAERAEQVAKDLGLGVDLAAEMTALSGGQAARAALASLLLSRYDILLLDEPTNDLDLAGLERLEEFVNETRVGLVVVSHDREFLARTVNRIVELDLAQQRVDIYNGSYDSYLAERATARRHDRENFEEYADTKASLEGRAQMQRNWLSDGVRNARRKATNDSDKASRKFRADASEKQAAKARQTQRRIERLEVVEEPRKEWELRMEIAAAPRSGTVVATLGGAIVRRGSAPDGFTLGPITAQVNWGDRIVITGENGAGKSTLLGLLLGKIEPDEGTASLGSGVALGEVDQARGLFLGEEPLAVAFGAAVPEWPDADVRTLLAKFGLRGAHVGRPAGSLSPGERTRAALALLQAREVNLLVLDEPTNHLDLPAIEQLEQAMESYDGTLLLVTHDRRMLDTVRATARWEIADGQLFESFPD